MRHAKLGIDYKSYLFPASWPYQTKISFDSHSNAHKNKKVSYMKRKDVNVKSLLNVILLPLDGVYNWILLCIFEIDPKSYVVIMPAFFSLQKSLFNTLLNP